MFDEIKKYPIYQAIARRSLRPFYEGWLTKEGRREMLDNLTNRGLVSFAGGANIRGGMPLAKPIRNFAPSVENMLKVYTRNNPGFNPKFYYKDGARYINVTDPANRRAAAESYQSRFNIKNWGERPRY